MKTTLTALLLATFLAHSAFSESWQPVGPYFAKPGSIVPVPRNPQIWLAISDSKLYRSTNNGSFWQFTRVTQVSRVVVHPTTSRILVFTGFDGTTKIWSSENLGTNFHLIHQSPLFFREIAFDVKSPHILVAIAQNDNGGSSLYLSLNGGYSWNDIGVQVTATLKANYASCTIQYPEFNSVVISPFESRTIYVAGGVRLGEPCYRGESILWAGNQLGQNWKIDGATPFTFMTDPYFPDRVFGLAYEGLSELSPGGFLKISPKRIGRVRSVPGNRQKLFGFEGLGFIDSYHFVASLDAGKSWHREPPPLPKEGWDFFAMRMPEGGFLAATEGGIYRTGPDLRWENVNRGFRESSVLRVAAAGTSIYALTAESFLQRSTNEGKSWTDLSLRLPNHFKIENIAVNPKNEANIIVGGDRIRNQFIRENFHFYVSLDSGRTWIDSLRLSRGDLGKMTFHPIHKNVVYLYGRNAVYISLDGGLRFRKLPSALGGDRIVVDPNGNKVLFLLTGRNVYKSIDGGRTFNDSDWGIQFGDSYVSDVAPAGFGNQFLAVDGWSIVYLTVDGGRRWQTFSALPEHTGGGGDPAGFWRLFPADLTGSKFYALHRSELQKSINGGRRWQRVKAPSLIPDRYYEFNDMSDPRNPRFYVATGHGLFLIR